MRPASPLVLVLAAAFVGLTVLPSAASAALEPGTTLPVAAGVPDQGRAWELVSTPDPENAVLRRFAGASRSGDHVVYFTIGQLLSSPEGETLFPVNQAARESGGWSNLATPSPYPELEGLEYAGVLMYDSQFENSLWSTPIPADKWGLFRHTPDGQYTLLEESSTEGAGFLDASTDLQHVVFSSEEHLLAADAARTSGASIYEFVGSTLRLVDVDDSGTLLSDCGSTGGGPNSISGAGGRIFFATHASCSGPARVYMRTDGATTTAISTTQCDLADCGPEKDVSFVGATPSGSSAFLLTEQRLTDADSDSGADLYRYDVASGRLTLLSADRGGGNLIPTAQPVLASEDGSRVYFEAREETGPGETNGPNLYAVNGSGSPRLVVSDVEATEAQSTFVSSDGRYALFTTDAPLEAGDTDEKMDVYRYDIEQGSATRISTGPSGGNGSFDAELFEESERPAPVFTFPLHGLSRRAMSEDGSRIFFTTAEQLVPQDHNEVVDVYEWADGNLGLVSSGAGTNGSEYLSATPDGGTVFFATSDVLVPSDRDGADKDIYAARIGGGFAEGPAARGCEGASCVARTVPPGRPVPTSARPDAGGIRLKPIDAAARRLILSTGWISLLVEVPGSGRLSAAARARIGHRSRTVASGSATVTPGPARLRMRLTKRARQTLASGHGLHVRLSLRLSGLDSVRRVGFELRSGK